MKFSLAIIALFAGAQAFVATPVERSPLALAGESLATVKRVFQDIENGFNELQAAAAAFNGDPQPLKDKAALVISKVDSGTRAIRKLSPLKLFECWSLIGPSNDLAKHGDAVCQELQSRKADVQKTKQCGTVLDILKRALASARALIAAVTDVAPPAVQRIVQAQGEKVLKPLKLALSNFAAGRCINAN